MGQEEREVSDAGAAADPAFEEAVGKALEKKVVEYQGRAQYEQDLKVEEYVMQGGEVDPEYRAQVDAALARLNRHRSTLALQRRTKEKEQVDDDPEPTPRRSRASDEGSSRGGGKLTEAEYLRRIDQYDRNDPEQFQKRVALTRKWNEQQGN